VNVLLAKLQYEIVSHSFDILPVGNSEFGVATQHRGKNARKSAANAPSTQTVNELGPLQYRVCFVQ
jgi:hypothetical protein